MSMPEVQMGFELEIEALVERLGKMPNAIQPLRNPARAPHAHPQPPTYQYQTTEKPIMAWLAYFWSPAADETRFWWSWIPSSSRISAEYLAFWSSLEPRQTKSHCWKHKQTAITHPSLPDQSPSRELPNGVLLFIITFFLGHFICPG
jgi:hypothetical protein